MFRPYIRSPVTAFRLAGSVALAALMFFPLEQSVHRRFASALGRELARAPSWIVSAIVATCQLGFLVPAVLFLLSQLVQRRFARVGRLLIASVVCVVGLVAMSNLVGESVFRLLPVPRAGGPAARYGIGTPFPTPIAFGVIATWFFMDSGQWSRRWRRFGWIVLGVGIVARLGVSLADPVTILATLTIALAAAHLVQLALGIPNTTARAATVGAALERLGYPMASVERLNAFGGYTGFRATRQDGGRFYVKVVSRHTLATLLPVRFYRAVRFREGPEDGPFRSLRSSVEHEAMCALKAHSDGVPTPRLAVVSEFPPDAMLLAFDSPRAIPLSDLEPEQRPPDVLAAVWAIIATLQRNHTVHHHLNLDALIVDDHGTVSLIEFGATSVGVTGSALSTDVAEVLAGTAARLGVEPAVQAAIDGVGCDAVAASLPRLQPLALTRRTRAALKASGCLDDLRAEVHRVTGAPVAPIAPLERVKSQTLATAALGALALLALVPQFIGVGAVWGRLGDANWWWVAAAILLSVGTYVGAALALDGALSERLPLVPNLRLHTATSFVGVAVPGGGLALTARFLQKRGVDGPTTAAAVGVNTFAGVLVHLTLTGLFIAFAGTSGLDTFQLPSLGVVGLIVASVALMGALGLAVPWSRVMVTTRLVPATRRSLTSVGEVARRPVKVVELLGGCLLTTLGYILALEVSVAAFGAGPSFTSVAIVYLVGSIISSVAPTPGGIGAVEATLIAGLTSAGMPGTTAVAAVLIFRLTTFWLPLLPGWGIFTLMRRSGEV